MHCHLNPCYDSNATFVRTRATEWPFISEWLLFFFYLLIDRFGALLILLWVGRCFIFKKAGYGGWEAIIPIYAEIIFPGIVNKPWWWIFLFFLAGLNLIR